MAGPSTDIPELLQLEALRRLLAHPRGLRLFGKGREPGLFANKGSTAQRLLDSLTSRNLIDIDASVESEPCCRLTARGLDWLLEKENPRLLLEDLLRASERQADSLRVIEQTVRAECARLEAQAGDVRRVLDALLQRIEAERTEAWTLEALAAYDRQGAPADCSLADLYRGLRARQATLSIGQFHDRIRALHAAGKVRLSPWTGPLYQLPEPALALLIGHEVLYYVQLSRSLAA